MSWWNAKYTNDHGEYEITFGSQDYEKAKAVEKVCCAVIDKTVKSPDDVDIVRHGRWLPQTILGLRTWDCSECKTIGSPHWKRCPVCEAKMDLEG